MTAPGVGIGRLDQRARAWNRRAVVFLSAAVVLATMAAGVSPMAHSDPITIGDGKSGPSDMYVSVSAEGFAVANVVVGTGHTVTYVNTDDSSRRLAFEPATGVQCTEASYVVQPAGQLTCIFTTSGLIAVSDQAGVASARQTVVVTAPDDILSSVTFHVERSSNPRSRIAVVGNVNIKRAGVQIDVIARRHGATTYAVIGQARTSADGAFALTLTYPRRGTFYVNALDLPRIVTSPIQTA